MAGDCRRRTQPFAASFRWKEKPHSERGLIPPKVTTTEEGGVAGRETRTDAALSNPGQVQSPRVINR